jgi:hypothetical protein
VQLCLQVAAHLWRCTCLRMACAPILAAPSAAQQQQQQASTADPTSAAAPSQAGVQQQLLEALASALQQHQQQEEGATGMRATKGAAAGAECVPQLLQLLLWCCGSPLTIGAVLDQVRRQDWD